MTITFVTSNKGKVIGLQKKLPETFLLEIVSNIDLPELQVDSSVDVVTQKAKEAYKILQKPLLVQDSSFHIPALGGFPGAYIKHTLKTIKLEGILKLMNGISQRECYFEDSIGYTEDGVNVKIFTSRNPGNIAFQIDSGHSAEAWSELWNIVIPLGCEKPLSSCTKEELEQAKEKLKPDSSCFRQFAEFIKLHLD